MSPELKQYLADWLNWAESDPQDDTVFSRKVGLCGNISRIYPYYTRRSVLLELAIILKSEFRETSYYPFGSSWVFHREFDTKSQHKNLKRLAWVRKQLEK